MLKDQKRKVKRYIPDDLLKIYRDFHQKRFEIQSAIPTVDEVLEVGAHTYGRENLNILFRDSGQKVKIGKFCSIAKDVTIFLGGDHRHDWVTTYPFGHVELDAFGPEQYDGHPSSKGSVVIGNDVWIGHGVTIMSGVNIGDGAVIAANSQVLKDIPPYGIAGGNPAKLMWLRFDGDTIARLLAVQWWDFPTPEIKSIKSQICQEPTGDTLDALELLKKKINKSEN